MNILTCVSTGQLIFLSQRIASSGEGEVWQTNRNGYLAKIYHTPNHERVQKLEVMIAYPPQEPNSHLNHISFAWPRSLLKDDLGNCVGFLMNAIASGKELGNVYNPRQRKNGQLEVDWRFLHTTALNIASIIQAIHTNGYVLGDINPRNILVNNRALPSIIDTDSFQVRHPTTSKVYRCQVGSPSFTPPELIGKDFSLTNQTEVHDRFRLALIIYHLLFGEHPFSGKWIGTGESPKPDELIRQGFWLHQAGSLIEPVERTIPINIVHQEILRYFCRCFNDGHTNPKLRPTAHDWVQVLRLAVNELTLCGKVDSHYFSRTYGTCYWCDRAKNLGVDIFPSLATPTSQLKVLTANDPIELVQQAGNEIIVVGQVVSLKIINNIFLIYFDTYLNFISNYSPLRIIIPASEFQNLANARTLTGTKLSNWVGQYIKIIGIMQVEQEHGVTTPQIILQSPEQVSVITQAEATILLAKQTLSAANSNQKLEINSPNKILQKPAYISNSIGLKKLDRLILFINILFLLVFSLSILLINHKENICKHQNYCAIFLL